MRWFHRHGPWEVVGAYCDDHLHAGSSRLGGFLITHVALRCQECGMVKAKDLTGSFTLAQLRGEELGIARILKSLEQD